MDDAGKQRKLLTWRNFTAIIVVYSTSVAIGKLLGIELYPWANLFRFTSHPYDLVIEVPFEWLQGYLHELQISLPKWTPNAFAIWVVLGRLVRLSIGDMAAQIEADHYEWTIEKPLPTVREKLSKLLKDPKVFIREWWQRPATKESVMFTIFPPGRLYVDIRGGYWSLTPKIISVYLGYSIGALALVVLADKTLGAVIFD